MNEDMYEYRISCFPRILPPVLYAKYDDTWEEADAPTEVEVEERIDHLLATARDTPLLPGLPDFDDMDLGEPVAMKCYYCGRGTNRTRHGTPTCQPCDERAQRKQ